MNHRPPTTVILHRARLIFVLTALIPTVLISAIGIILLASGGSPSFALVGGVLLLAFCATALAGYTLGTIFVTRGASLASVQNEFLSSVSHELRTPLTSIRMFIDTLREDRVSDPDERKRCLTVVNQELTRLDGLVGELIELSKIESRRAALDQRAVRIADVVDDAIASFEALKVGSDFDIDVKVEPGLVVRGDRAALAQAIGNLLGNAWKYTSPRDKQIEIRAEGDLKRVSITVTDNGIGIPRVEQEAIFEKFQRGAKAVESRTQGNGLGLAIVKAIVEAHRGEVDVRSQVDAGSRFRVVLPRCKTDVA